MSSLPQRLDAILALDPDAPALEFDGRWYPWSDISTTANDVAAAMAQDRHPLERPSA